MSIRQVAARRGWLTAKDAARRCGFAASTIYRWAAQEQVESERVAGVLFVSEASLKRHLGKLGSSLMEAR